MTDKPENYRVTPGWYPTARRPYAGLSCVILVRTYLRLEGPKRQKFWRKPNGMLLYLKYDAYTSTEVKMKTYFLKKLITQRYLKGVKITPTHTFNQLVKEVDNQISLIEADKVVPTWFWEQYYEFSDRCTPPTDEEIRNNQIFETLAQ